MHIIKPSDNLTPNLRKYSQVVNDALWILVKGKISNHHLDIQFLTQYFVLSSETPLVLSQFTSVILSTSSIVKPSSFMPIFDTSIKYPFTSWIRQFGVLQGE